MTITFEGVELRTPAPFGWSTPAGSETLLQSGYISVQVSAARPLKWSFVCQTTTLADITNLEVQKGVFGRLIIDGTTYANVAIVGEISVVRYGPNDWEYSVSFTQSV